MSLTGEIANLVGKADELIDTFKAKEAGINQAVQAAVAAVPDLVKTVFLDPIAGSDANSGQSIATAVRSMGRALSLIGPGRAGEVVLVNDYTLNAARAILPLNSLIRVSSATGERRRLVLGLHEFVDDTADWEVGGFYAPSYGFNTLGLYRVDIVFPSAPEGVIAKPRYSALLGSNHTTGPAILGVELSGCTITRPADGVGCILGSDSRGCSLAVKDTVYDSDLMAGNWIAGAAAGALPSSVSWALTNLTSL